LHCAATRARLPLGVTLQNGDWLRVSRRLSPFLQRALNHAWVTALPGGNRFRCRAHGSHRVIVVHGHFSFTCRFCFSAVCVRPLSLPDCQVSLPRWQSDPVVIRHGCTEGYNAQNCHFATLPRFSGQAGNGDVPVVQNSAGKRKTGGQPAENPGSQSATFTGSTLLYLAGPEDMAALEPFEDAYLGAAPRWTVTPPATPRTGGGRLSPRA
jgi:hypothetical protein